jgi:hypothetical protein
MMANEVSPARVLKFDQCHDTIFIYRNDGTGELAERGNHCQDRLCMVCGRARSARIADALEERIADMHPIFLTLTVRGGVGKKLASQLEILLEGFKRLRRMPIWSAVVGGVAMLEVKWSTHGGGHWHPHLHCLLDSRYMEQGQLVQAWSACTGGSTSVDIRRVDNRDQALRYVSKYASKPMCSSFTDKVWKIQEAMSALKGRRLVTLFGDWYGTPLNEEEEEELPPFLTNWRCCGTERKIRCEADDGDRSAIALLEDLERHRSRRHDDPDG